MNLIISTIALLGKEILKDKQHVKEITEVINRAKLILT